jgi:phosphoribosylamine--glycine ligase
MASKGYPTTYDKGFAITIPDEIAQNVYVAGAEDREGVLVTSGGRVLGATAIADSLEDAISGAYAMVKKIRFDNAFYRNDIGARALKAGRN